jgi:hypothetical protein
MGGIELMDVAEIALLLRKTVASVRSDASRNPMSLPPVCRVPGSRRLLWRLEDVNVWLTSCVEQRPQVSGPATLLASNEPKRRGRPRKTEVHA